MAKRCYYETLSVERTASDGDIKAAFRKQAMQWHPDRNPGDDTAEHRFKELNEAYEILKDPDKRAAYDRFGHAAFEHGGVGAAHGFGADFATTFSDIFDDLFGMNARRGRGSGRERGADLRYNMEISLQEAYAGKTASVRIPTSVTCEACSGTGAKPGTKPKACAMCAGQGKVRHAQGFFTLERTCPSCHGRGQVIESPCASCQWLGPRDARADVVGEYSGRRRGWHPHPACRRGRSRRARRAGRRSLHLPVAWCARVLSARWRRPALSRPGLDGDRVARWRVRSADDRRRQDAGQSAGGHARPVSAFACPGRECRCCARGRAATCTYRLSSRRRRSSARSSARLLAEFDRLSSPETQPKSTGFFGKVKELLGGKSATSA